MGEGRDEMTTGMGTNGEQSETAEELEIDRLRAINTMLRAQLEAAVAEEREACAAALETMAAEQAAVAAPYVDPFAIRVHAMTVRTHAALIRARGGK